MLKFKTCKTGEAYAFLFMACMKRSQDTKNWINKDSRSGKITLAHSVRQFRPATCVPYTFENKKPAFIQTD